MKTLNTIRLTILIGMLLPILAHGQERTPFLITSPIYKSTYNGKMVKRMRFKELKAVLLTTGDEQIAEDVKQLQTKSSVGGAFLYTGTGLLLVGSALNLASTMSDVRTVNSGRVNVKDETPGTGFVVGATVVILIGAIIHSGYKKTLSRAIFRHNDIIRNTSLVPSTTSVNGQHAMGAQLTVRF